MDLVGKRAVVCGSTQGIGRAIAFDFARCGSEVVLVARDKTELEKMLMELPKNHGQDHAYVSVDFARPDDLKKQVGEFLSKRSHQHILVNNTGGPPPGKIVDAGLDELRFAFSNHVLCNHILMQLCLAGMKALKYGRIINIVSTSAKQPIENLGVSNTVRAAVANWAKTLANELGQFGITVNNILPGFTNTQRLSSLMETMAKTKGKSLADLKHELYESIPVRRFAEPEEIAYAASFLASEQGSYISGINLPVDGGRTVCL